MPTLSAQPAAWMLPLALVAGSLAAQTKSAPVDRLTDARATYYTPTANGLASFECSVSSDWKDMLTRFSGSAIEDDNPFLLYMNAAHLSVKDDLTGDGALTWKNTATPPDGIEKPANQVRDGIIEMFSGFFTSWNAYMNGTMVPSPDETTTVKPTAAGYHLHATATDSVLDEDYNQNMLLTEVHAVTKGSDVLAYPVYENTPDGRVVSSIRSLYKEHPADPQTELSMSVTYATVSGFRLPATLRIDEKNVGVFLFHLGPCTVQRNDATVSKH